MVGELHKLDATCDDGVDLLIFTERFLDGSQRGTEIADAVVDEYDGIVGLFEDVGAGANAHGHGCYCYTKPD